MMKRLDYETPTMREIVIEAEEGFLVASKEVIEDKDYSVVIKDQTEETGFIINSWE